MGYTTDFTGSLELSTPATPAQLEYINRFSDSRRMKRNVDELIKLYNGKYGLEGVGYGVEGEYFAYDEEDSSVLDVNRPPSTQPGLWCDWVLSKDGKYLEWNGGEKFYNYVEWLTYIIQNFFERWGIKLNGEIEWYGEDRDDMGKIVVVNNEVTVKHGKVVFD